MSIYLYIFHFRIMWHWSLYLALLPEVSDSPSLCNNWLRLWRLHWRPALAVRVEVICNKKQSGNIPPPLPPPGLADRSCRRGGVQLGLDTQIRPAWPHITIHHWSAATLQTRGSDQWPGSLTTNCRTRIDMSHVCLFDPNWFVFMWCRKCVCWVFFIK